MTKLESDIEKAILSCGRHSDTGKVATATAEVCKGYIERAFFEGGNGMQWTGNEWKQEKTLQEFLKSEGITE